MKNIHRDQLLETLGFKNHKIPPNLEKDEYDIPCYDWWINKYRERQGKLIGYFRVIIKKSQGKKHRIFIQCKCCYDLVPIGRTSQHKCKL